MDNQYGYPYHYWPNPLIYSPSYWEKYIRLIDYGPEPFVINIEEPLNKTIISVLPCGLGTIYNLP